MSKIKDLARPFYSFPPIHGARLVDTVLSDSVLTDEWHQELKIMSGRIAEMRKGLVQNLQDKGSRHNWQHVLD
jgi:aspartate aminotransferase